MAPAFERGLGGGAFAERDGQVETVLAALAVDEVDHGRGSRLSNKVDGLADRGELGQEGEGLACAINAHHADVLGNANATRMEDAQADCRHGVVTRKDAVDVGMLVEYGGNGYGLLLRRLDEFDLADKRLKPCFQHDLQVCVGALVAGHAHAAVAADA